MATAFYPGLAVNAAEDAREANAAIRAVKGGLREEISELRSMLTSVKKAKPTTLVCIDPGAGQPRVCLPRSSKGAIKRAKAERSKVEKQISKSIKMLESRLKKVK